MRDKLYLIDGTALLYRSYYAFVNNPLINSKGENTSAIYGVVNSFLHLLDSKKAENLLISFDRKAPTFRHELSEAYKANRPPMPDALLAQVEPVQEFFRIIGLKEISIDGYEADDVLATLAERFKTDYDIVFVTIDKDYAQLVDDKAVIYDPMKNITLDKEAIVKKYGILPEQFVDFLALAGDPSDNIPGVRGIGEVTAVKLLKQYSNLDEIYAHLDEIPEKLRQKLIEGKDNAYLSRQLAMIIRNVPIEIPRIEALKFNPESLHKAKDFLTRYEINTLKRLIDNRYGQKIAISIPSEEPDKLVQSDIFESKYTVPSKMGNKKFQAILATAENYSKLLDDLKKVNLVSLDTETTSEDAMQADLVGISLCFKSDEAWYIPIGHKEYNNFPKEQTLRELNEALQGKLILGHNIKYDMIVLHQEGWNWDNKIGDTMIAAYLLDPGTNQYSLETCTATELQYEMITFSSLINKKACPSFDLLEVEKACDYSAEDAWAVYMLYPIYLKRLENTGLKELYENIEIPLIPVLQQMEENGVSIDTEVLKEISKNINQELEKLTEEIYAYAGYEFNINSTQQLAKVLFEEKKLPAKKKTKSGYSTDSAVLEELAEKYEIAEKLLQYRMLSKLESTYVSALPKLINPRTGKIHSSFNQTVTSTGRLSSSNPNLQNIPVRTDLGKTVRKAFIATDPDWELMDADYSQIELRLLALMSGDQVLIDSFKQDLDIHRQTAALITGKPLNDVTDEERRRAKVINFGLLYGMGQKKLSRELGISQEEAKKLIDEYFHRFPTIQAFINNCKAEARLHGFCQTLFGRKLYLKNINSSNQGLRAEAERVAVNMPIQGTAADLIKIAMIDIHKQIKDNPRIKMILQVHDELVFEVHKEFLLEAEKLVKKAMEEALPEKYSRIVTLKVDIGHGHSWFNAH
ncbi:MAG TPA: DNA polymerase I [Candidatus Syntrophosphaera thermopropionivorans]|nr:DNA polymerase I [Candidatus Syntrophosphaera thermopropionivorans]